MDKKMVDKICLAILVGCIIAAVCQSFYTVGKVKGFKRCEQLVDEVLEGLK